MITAREQFLSLVFTAPLRKADAIVVLTGDGSARIATAMELLKVGAAPRIVLSGGKNDPPYAVPASALATTLIGRGVAPDRIVVENASQHTQEQAIQVIDRAVAAAWKTLLLVASPFHLPRAVLTFVRELERRSLELEIRVVPVATADLRWSHVPDGHTETRLTLLREDLAKCAAYADHVTTFENGRDYLIAWDGRPG